MKKFASILMLLVVCSFVFADGGTEKKPRVSRFESSPDNISSELEDKAKLYIPETAKGKEFTFIDMQMMTMVEIKFLMPVKDVKDPASDFTSVHATITTGNQSLGEMAFKMTIDGTSDSKRKEMLREMKTQFNSTKTKGFFRPRVFSEAEAVKSKDFTNANIWIQKWVTEDDLPAQTWYDCFYVVKSGDSVVCVTVYAAPTIEAADKIALNLVNKTVKKK